MKTNTNINTNNRKISKAEIIRKDFSKYKTLYAMAIPVLLYFIVFKYLPMYGAIIAFKNYKPSLGIMESPFVGLEHFKTFFSSPSFGTILVNTLRISLSSLVFSFPMPIIFALLLNELRSEKFSKVVQNAAYLPHFISLVVICGMVTDFTMDDGIINCLLSIFGFEPKSLLNYPQYFVPIYVISGIWQEVGWASIVYLAALTAVDAQLYEAAMIDGAGRLKQTLHVTLPCIAPTIVTMLILRVGQILNVGFEKIILLYNDNTLDVADVISTYVYRKGLLEQSWSFSSAVGLFNSAINFIFIIATNYISKKASDTALW